MRIASMEEGRGGYGKGKADDMVAGLFADENCRVFGGMIWMKFWEDSFPVLSCGVRRTSNRKSPWMQLMRNACIQWPSKTSVCVRKGEEI